MAEPCGFPGNSDLYGLGIRVGIYIQWISALVSSYFHLDDTNLLRFNYFAFSLAVMSSLLVLTFQGDAHTIEIIIMLYMFFGGLYSISPTSARGRQPATPLSKRLILGPVTGFIMLIYSSWFWISGRDSDRFVVTPCGNSIFLFARISPRHFGRVSIFFAVLSILLAVAVFVAAVRYYFPYIAGLVERWRNTETTFNPTHIVREIDRENSAADLSATARVRTSLRHLRVGMRAWVQLFSRKPGDAVTSNWATRVYLFEIILPPVSCIYSILAIELMLRWNLVSDVYTVGSTGQLIPVIVSGVGFVDILFNIRSKYQQRRHGNESKIVHSETRTDISRPSNGEIVEDGETNGRQPLQYPDGRWV
ncbi:hypothetical protein BJY04DRAFT_224350 [Aspergillus karnatakaensis]|uniref:uncharacterized protein n=1 Tax=Aspergillus karnatakaensis TaxID=1810916 RepID=UPI003CCD235B